MQKAKKAYFKESTKQGFSTSKQFWNLIKPFLTNKGSLSNDCITIKDGDKFVNNEKDVVEMFNNHYINIVEKTSGIPPEDTSENYDDAESVKNIIENFKNHPSIIQIKNKRN